MMRLGKSGALVLGLGLVVDLAGQRPAAAATPTAPSCPPGAQISGTDEALVREVVTLLASRGVRGIEGLAAGCFAPEFEVQREGGPTSALIVRRADGASEPRHVSNPSVAAVVIESWVRLDLLAPPEPETEPETKPPAPREPPATGPRELDGIRLSASFYAGLGLGADGSTWANVAGAGCARMGPTCIGLGIRTHFDLGLAGDSADRGTDRLGLDVLIVAEFPLHVGGFLLTPGIALGAGWLRSSTSDVLTQDAIEFDAGGPRVAAELRADWQLSEATAFEANLEFSLAPLAHATPFNESGVLLAGEPLWFLRLGFGLRFGAQ